MPEPNKSARTYLMFAVVAAILFIVNAVISNSHRKDMQQQLTHAIRQRDSVIAEEVKLKEEISRMRLSISKDSAGVTVDSVSVGKDMSHKRK